MIKTIYLDMDGVIADFTSTKEKYYGKEGPYWPQFVREGRFRQLEPMPGAHDLVSYLSARCRILGISLEILSSLGQRSESAEDRDMSCMVHDHKLYWLRRHEFDHIKTNFVAKRKLKSMFAEVDTLLIDDELENVQNFSTEGGHAILHTSNQSTLITLETLTPYFTQLIDVYPVFKGQTTNGIL